MALFYKVVYINELSLEEEKFIKKNAEPVFFGEGVGLYSIENLLNYSELPKKYLKKLLDKDCTYLEV